MRSRSPHFSAHQSTNSGRGRAPCRSPSPACPASCPRGTPAPRPASAACRWRRGRAGGGTPRREHSGDGVRPRSFHFAIELLVDEVVRRQRRGRSPASRYGSVTCATSAWPPKRIMTCVSPAALRGDEAVGVTAATASLRASNWAVAVTSSRRPSVQVAVTASCCCSPGTITRAAPGRLRASSTSGSVLAFGAGAPSSSHCRSGCSRGRCA